MQHCNDCNVDVAGDKACCPLCGGALSGEGDAQGEMFPVLPNRRKISSLILRLLALIGITASVTCILINYTVMDRIYWSLFVAAGAASTWVTVWIALHYRKDVVQNITWQVFLLSFLAVAFDKWTRWYGWSLNFVVPSICLIGLLVLLVLCAALRLPVSRVAGRLSIIALLGIGTGVLAMLGKLRFPIPSLVCTGVSVVVLAFLVIFQWQAIKSELIKRFHL